jgi:hypothetical protein
MSVSENIKGVIGISLSKISSPDPEFAALRTRPSTVSIESRPIFYSRFEKWGQASQCVNRETDCGERVLPDWFR